MVADKAIKMTFKSSHLPAKCLACGGNLSIIQAFNGGRFCSPKHARDHIVEMNTIALQRLRENAERLNASESETEHWSAIRFS